MDLTYLEKMKLTPNVAVVDIETEGTDIDAVICTIGCVIKNVFTGDVVGEFYLRCETTEQQGYRSITAATQDFWVKERKINPEAYDECFNPLLSRKYLDSALVLLNEFLKKHFQYRPQVMGNGPEFDNAILEHAMSHFGIKPAWDFGCNQSLRTVVLLGRLLLGIDPKNNVPFDGIRHHALYDARHEAECLRVVFQALLSLADMNCSGFKIMPSLLNSELEIYEKNNFDPVNPEASKLQSDIVREFFEQHNFICEE